MPQNQSSPIPTLTLNDGVQLPPLGYGVFQTPPEATVAAVQPALRVGYRHIDTAAGYGNEREVGEGIRRSGIDRSDVFLETKVWISDYGYDATLHAFDKSAAKLGVEQIDLLILHQPMPTAFDRTVAAYKALESLLADGRVRAIGVSNFMPDHVDRLLADVSVVPAVNRVEVHPYFRQTAVLEKDAENGVVSQAWSPIGGITFYPGWGASDRRSTVDDPVLRSIGERYGKTAAQVGLRWHLEQGRSAIPKSVNARGGRVLGLLPLVGALALTAVACATGSAAERRENLTRVRITIGKTVLTAHLQDNPTARPLIAQLPLTLSFRDFHGQEKVAGLPRPLSMRGMPKSADPRPGEIGYYAPTRELVLYTTDVGRFDGIARIGRFDGSVAAIRNRKSDFVARIELARWRQ